MKTSYELRISDWSSDVCSSYLNCAYEIRDRHQPLVNQDRRHALGNGDEAPDRLAVLKLIENFRGARAFWDEKFPGLHRIGRSEQAGHGSEGRGTAGNGAHRVELLRYQIGRAHV